jgi:lipid II:glycine glycyltransferase (peptidoglycan interpeptide bridge formation enzyme)
MLKNNADKYYFFSRKYFNNVLDLLNGSAFIFNAIYENKTIASALVLKYGDYAHYHLSGTDYDYINLSPAHLLIYEVAQWGREQGCKYLHLGGGYKGNEDSLFTFKKKFSRGGIVPFYTGRKTHNEQVYKKLVERWYQLNNKENDEKIDFFPIYRK